MADGVPFQEAIDFLRRRLALPDGEWERLLDEMTGVAQQRAERLKQALLRGFLDAVLRALEEGTTIASFRDAYERLVAELGWSYDGDKGWHSELVFRRLSMEAYAAGRWEQIQRLKQRRPYLRYVTAGDHRVRDAHRAWHGVILHVDHPWWKTHYPPNGWNCRCHVQQLSERDLRRYNLKVWEAAPADTKVIKFVRGADGAKRPVEVPIGIDPGFDVNVGEVGLALRDAA